MDNDLEILIDYPYVNQTIDTFFQSLQFSKKDRHFLRMSHRVYLNDQPIKQNFSLRLKLNDRLRLPFFNLDQPDFIPEPIPIDIAYEDDFFLVVNKPPFYLVHPASKEGTGTLVNAVSHYYFETNQRCLVRYLHRLDYETSGLILFIKARLLQPRYDALIKANRIIRRYLAITDGIPNPKKQTIDLPIGRHRHRSNRFRVSSTGQRAITHIETLTISKHRLALVQCELVTGRTHQIRVHLSAIGTPIIGDKLYHAQPNPFPRTALHASELIFPYPFTDQLLTVSSDLPADLKKLWDEVTT